MNPFLPTTHKSPRTTRPQTPKSTKLSLYEKRVVDMVLETKALPEKLAATGHVALPEGMVERMLGRLFIQRCAPRACVRCRSVWHVACAYLKP
jgi:hypothetical protein